MEKPPFQFGLKAVFAAVTGIALLMATWIAVPELLLSITAFLACWLFAILLVRFCERL